MLFMEPTAGATGASSSVVLDGITVRWPDGSTSISDFFFTHGNAQGQALADLSTIGNRSLISCYSANIIANNAAVQSAWEIANPIEMFALRWDASAIPQAIVKFEELSVTVGPIPP